MIPSWTLHFAWRQLFPCHNRGALFTYLSILGIAIGSGLLLVLDCVLNGLQGEIGRKIALVEGDITITSRGPFRGDRDLLDRLGRLNGVRNVATQSAAMVMARGSAGPFFCLARAVDPPEFFAGGLVFDGSTNGPLLGRILAENNGVRTGDHLELYSPAQLNGLDRDELILPLDVEAAGTFRTGWNEVDGEMVLLPMETMDELLDLRGHIHGILLRLDPGEPIARLAAFLNGSILPPDLRATTWLDNHQDLLYVLRMEKYVLMLVMVFILLSAVFSMGSVLMTTINRKRREIGLLTAFGATRRQTMGCFLWQGLILACLGNLLALGASFLLLSCRNVILCQVLRFFRADNALSELYTLSSLPCRFVPSDCCAILLFSFVLTVLSAYLPARSVLKLNPSSALRYE